MFSSTQSDIQSIIRYYGEFYNVRIEMGRLNDAQRHEAIGMIRGGAPKRELARQMGCSHQTITQLIQWYNDTCSVKDRQRPGRQRVTLVRQDRQIVITHLRDRFRTATQTARDTKGVFNRRVSASTVIRRLRQAGLWTHTPFRGNVLTPNRRRNWLDWCRRHFRWTQRDWQTVLFSDESRFCFNVFDRRKKV